MIRGAILEGRKRRKASFLLALLVAPFVAYLTASTVGLQQAHAQAEGREKTFEGARACETPFSTMASNWSS